MYFDRPFSAASKSSGPENSFGFLSAWLWKPTGILCFSAKGSILAAVLTLPDAVITLTPSALAISKPRSISASEKSSRKLRL